MFDGASRGKPGAIGIGGILRNHSGVSSMVFMELVGCGIQKRWNSLALGEH